MMKSDPVRGSSAEYVLFASNVVLLIVILVLSSLLNRIENFQKSTLPDKECEKAVSTDVKSESKDKKAGICTRTVYNADIQDHVRRIVKNGHTKKIFIPGRKIRAKSYRVNKEQGLITFTDESGHRVTAAEEMVHNFDRKGFQVEYDCDLP